MVPALNLVGFGFKGLGVGGEEYGGGEVFFIRLSDALFGVKRNSEKGPVTSPCAKKSWRLQVTSVWDP
jgi:hypothetical protein